ncbi:MAG: family 16 glycosylhydrolase [Bacteroidaceae bacterium]|nr:family 16 glycosylhydrolase [Bacteroidaceae bacterium]
MYKRIIVCALLTIGGWLSVCADDYKLVWEDNFDGAVLNETDHWNIEVNGNGGGNNELQYYRRENVSLGTEPVTGASCLILTARKEVYNGKTATSGRVNTLNKVYAKYGKVEARINFPYTANGLWPAFWMMGNDYSSVGWPKCGEIDIIELGQADGIARGTQDRHLVAATHWGPSWKDHPNYGKSTTHSESVQGDFHLFTLIWNAKSVSMYVDLDKNPNAEPYYVMNIDDDTNEYAPGQYFHKPNFILLNLAVGGNFPNIHNIDNVTALDNGDAKMYVDWVRIYQKGDDGEEFHCSTSGIHTGVKERAMQVYRDGDVLRVEDSNDELLLYNAAGVLVRMSETDEINVAGLPSGIYIVKCGDTVGKVVL